MSTTPKWFLPVSVVALLWNVMGNLALFGLTDAAAAAGPVALILQGVVLLVAIGLVVLSKRASAEGWLS